MELVLTFRAGTELDAPWVVIHGARVEEIEAILDSALMMMRRSGSTTC